MSRVKKDSVPVSIRMEKAISDKLDSFCEISGQSKTTAIERALELYFASYKQGLSIEEMYLAMGNTKV